MIPPLFFDGSKVYLPYMLLYYLYNCTRVLFRSGVQITAHQEEAGSSRQPSAFAKGEEYLAQTFLYKPACRDPKE